MDEPGCIGRLEPAKFVHGRLLLVVQTLGCNVRQTHASSLANAHLVRIPSLDDHVPLEQLEPDDPVHGPLTRRNRARQKLTLRREKMPIIQDPPQLDRDELVAERTDVPIECEPLEIDVRHAEDGRARGLVAPARLDPDKPVLDDIDPADPVFPRERVELEEDLDGVGVRLVGRGDGDGDGETGFELDRDVVGRGGGAFDRLGELPHVRGGRRVGVFEDAGFVGDVEEVFVRRPGFGGGLLDGNGFFGGVREEGLTARETVVKLCACVP